MVSVLPLIFVLMLTIQHNYEGKRNEHIRFKGTTAFITKL